MHTTNEFSFVLKPSTISGGGVGIFTLHDIDKDVRLDILPEGYEARILKTDDIPDDLRVYCVAQPDGKTWRCPKKFNHMEMSWYINHSKNSNARFERFVGFFSTRPIKKGEELFLNYNELNEPEELKEDYYKHDK